MRTYDPFTDDSEHIGVGPYDFRLGLIAHCLGIPASTLASLRAGTHVVVPHDPTEAMLDAAQDEQVGCCTPTQREARIIYQAMLAAAQPRRDEGNG